MRYLKHLRIIALIFILALGLEFVMSRLAPNPLTRPSSLLERLAAGVMPSAEPSEASTGNPRKTDSPHKTDDPHNQLNRLIHEKSPYLRQHADNPVDWYPWGEAAFAKAQEENKPIFLSIGYSTCHWCHVMERESFSQPDTAAVMNELFVNIKVDREERPDVDQVYMTFVQATTGSGGWPLSVWLTPDRKPIVGGTYFPPVASFGRPSFVTILRRIGDAWEKDAPAIQQQANSVISQLKAYANSSTEASGGLPGRSLLKTAVESLGQSYDSLHGGFGGAPKFPRPSQHNLLHTVAAQPAIDAETRSKALELSTETLRKIAAGGIHDHIGGGFHRYSVDRYWHVPHFEKMLYDQAQLAMAYLDAYLLTDDSAFADVARDILHYVSRDMSDPQGGFYSAEDADSLPFPNAAHKAEGAFYIWEKEEIDRLLGQDAPLFNFVYGVEADGNVRPGSDPHGEHKGKNTLYRKHTLSEASAQFNLPEDEAALRLEQARRTLFAAREKRPRPHLDDKILTDWNGLMISAYARAYQVLGDDSYLRHATSAAHFIRQNLYQPHSGTLLHSYRKGPADIEAFAADYAFLIQGLLDLYESDFDISWLQWAASLQEKQDLLFWDNARGGYFASTGKDETVLLRMKEQYDGALPSENSVSALNLLRLSSILDNPQWRQMAEAAIRSVSQYLVNSPRMLPQMLVSLDAAQSKPAQVVIAGRPQASDTQELLKIVRENAKPHQVLLLADGGSAQAYLATHADFLSSVSTIDGKATAYVCENFVCQLPTADPQKLRELMRGGDIRN